MCNRVRAEANLDISHFASLLKLSAATDIHHHLPLTRNEIIAIYKVRLLSYGDPLTRYFCDKLINDKKNGITKNYQEPATIKKERCGARTCEREREKMSSVSKV